MNILLCSPFYKDKETTTCGIANWTRNIMSKQTCNSSIHVDLLPFDRSVDLDEESTFWERLTSGIRDYIGLVNKFRKKLNHFHYDIVQVSTSAGLGLIRDFLIVKLAKKYNVKVVFHYHFGKMPEIIIGSNWQSKLMLKILNLSFGSIVMDKNSFEVLKRRGYNVYYLPNPLSEQNFRKINELRKRTDRIPNRILFVGHVVPTKGVFELVQATVNIENVTVRIVGKVFPDTKQQLMDISKKRDAGKWLTFVGEIPHDDVLREMLKCEMFVLPTYTEGFPNVILEAMACSCPIVTSSVGAIPEMLDTQSDFPCGVVVAPKDSDIIRKSINMLLSDRSQEQLFGERARKKIEENYTVDAIWLQLENIWLNMIEN